MGAVPRRSSSWLVPHPVHTKLPTHVKSRVFSTDLEQIKGMGKILEFLRFTESEGSDAGKVNSLYQALPSYVQEPTSVRDSNLSAKSC